MTTYIVRTAGWAGSAALLAADWRVTGERSQNCAPYMGSGRDWLAGDWPSMGGDVLNITAAAWTAGFLRWRSGNKKRTQNVSEYMLVLALCLVISVMRRLCCTRQERQTSRVKSVVNQLANNPVCYTVL